MYFVNTDTDTKSDFFCIVLPIGIAYWPLLFRCGITAPCYHWLFPVVLSLGTHEIPWDTTVLWFHTGITGANRQYQEAIQSKTNPICPIPLSKIFWFFKDVYEKGLLPYWREGMYDQLLWRIRESLWNICRLVNKSVNYWTCQNVPKPKNTFFGSGRWKIWKPGSKFWKVWKIS